MTPLRRAALPDLGQDPWVVGAGAFAAVAGALLALTAYALGPMLTTVLVLGVAFVVIAAARPAWGVAGAMLFVPFEFVAVELPSGSATATEAAFAVVGLGYIVRAILFPDSVLRPRARDLPIAALLLAVAAGLVVAEDTAPVARVLILWTLFAGVYLQAQSFSPRDMRLVLGALIVGVGVLGLIGTYAYVTSTDIGLNAEGEATSRAAGTPDVGASNVVAATAPITHCIASRRETPPTRAP